MRPVVYRFRAELRQRARAWIALALIVGLAGGLVVALLAGARRTDSAYDRLLREQDAYNVLFVSGIPGLFEFAPLDLDAIAGRPDVVDSAPLEVLAVSGVVPNGTLVTPEETNVAGDPTGRFGVEINRFKVLEGRLANPQSAREIVATFPAAEQLSLSVGDTFAVHILDRDEVAAAFAEFAGATLEEIATQPPLQELEMVGIVADPNGFPPAADPTNDLEFVFVTPALLAANADAHTVSALAVRVEGGQSAAASLIASVESATDGGFPVSATTSAEQAEAVNRSLAPLSRAVLVAGALAAIVAALVVGQILARQAFVESSDLRTLGALGFTRREHRRLRLLKAAIIGAVGAAVGAVTAILLSTLFPIGLAQTAEPHPGRHVDAVVVIGGALAIFASTTALGAVLSVRRDRSPRPPGARIGATTRTSPSAVLAWLATAAPGAVARAGTRLAAAGGGGVSALAGVGLGLVTVIAMVTFVASLDHLRDRPDLYGWTWDLTVGGDFGEPLERDGIEALAGDPEVRDIEAGAPLDAELDGRRMRVLATDPVKGDIEPAILSGRAPLAGDEIALRPGVAPDVRTGDVVELRLGSKSVSVEVVGRAALPQADVLVAFATAQRLVPETSAQLVLVALQPGTDVDAFAGRATAALGLGRTNAEPAQLPQDLVNFGRADATPAVIAALMGLVAVATLLHALLSAVQRSRRTLAVLRTMGFTTRQLIGTVAWQAALLVVTALVVAVPVGIALGRLLWFEFADQLGVIPRPAVPALALVAVAVAAVLVGMLVAGLPGWRAGRVSPATVLRTED